jgi:pilus assembly protein CpaF
VLWRLETMALMSDVDLPVVHVRDQVASAVDVVVHMARLRNGRRVVYQVATVDGVRDGEPVVTEVFGFRPRLGARGAFLCNGIVPALAGVLADRGENLPSSVFEPGPDGTDPAQQEASSRG